MLIEPPVCPSTTSRTSQGFEGMGEVAGGELARV